MKSRWKLNVLRGVLMMVFASAIASHRLRSQKHQNWKRNSVIHALNITEPQSRSNETSTRDHMLKKFSQSWKFYAQANDIAKREKLRKALVDALKSMDNRHTINSMATTTSMTALQRIQHAAMLLKEFKTMYKMSKDVMSSWNEYKSAKKGLLTLGRKELNGTKTGGSMHWKDIIGKQRRRSNIAKPVSVLDDSLEITNDIRDFTIKKRQRDAREAFSKAMKALQNLNENVDKDDRMTAKNHIAGKSVSIISPKGKIAQSSRNNLEMKGLSLGHVRKNLHNKTTIENNGKLDENLIESLVESSEPSLKTNQTVKQVEIGIKTNKHGELNRKTMKTNYTINKTKTVIQKQTVKGICKQNGTITPVSEANKQPPGGLKIPSGAQLNVDEQKGSKGSIKQEVEALARLSEAKKAKKKFEEARKVLADKMHELIHMTSKFQEIDTNDGIGTEVSQKTYISEHPPDDHPGAALSGVIKHPVKPVSTETYEDFYNHHGFTLGNMDMDKNGKHEIELTDTEEDSKKSRDQNPYELDIPERTTESTLDISKLLSDNMNKEAIYDKQRKATGKHNNDDDEILRTLSEAIEKDMKDLTKNEQHQQQQHKTQKQDEEEDTKERLSIAAKDDETAETHEKEATKPEDVSSSHGDDPKADSAFKEVENYLSKALDDISTTEPTKKQTEPSTNQKNGEGKQGEANKPEETEKLKIVKEAMTSTHQDPVAKVTKPDTTTKVTKPDTVATAVKQEENKVSKGLSFVEAEEKRLQEDLKNLAAVSPMEKPSSAAAKVAEKEEKDKDMVSKVKEMQNKVENAAAKAYGKPAQEKDPYSSIKEGPPPSAQSESDPPPFEHMSPLELGLTTPNPKPDKVVAGPTKPTTAPLPAPKPMFAKNPDDSDDEQEGEQRSKEYKHHHHRHHIHHAKRHHRKHHYHPEDENDETIADSDEDDDYIEDASPDDDEEDDDDDEDQNDDDDYDEDEDEDKKSYVNGRAPIRRRFGEQGFEQPVIPMVTAVSSIVPNQPQTGYMGVTGGVPYYTQFRRGKVPQSVDAKDQVQRQSSNSSNNNNNNESKDEVSDVLSDPHEELQDAKKSNIPDPRHMSVHRRINLGEKTLDW